MKIIEENQGSGKNKLLFSRFFGELYYFFALHIYVVLSIFGLALSIAILLFFAEIIFPGTVHIFNYSMTDKAFSELVKDNKHHAAIAFMETKKDLIEKLKEKNPSKWREIQQELAYCYVLTGDYPKALEQYRILRKWFYEIIESEHPKDWPPAQIQKNKDLIEMCFLKEEFQIYLKIGDIANVRSNYGKMKSLHENTDWDKIGDFLGEEGEKKIIRDIQEIAK